MFFQIINIHFKQQLILVYFDELSRDGGVEIPKDQSIADTFIALIFWNFDRGVELVNPNIHTQLIFN